MKQGLLLLPALVALGACAASNAGTESEAGGPSKSRVTAATPVGAPQNCVNIRDIRESRVLSDQVIDFHLNNGKVLRNTLPNRCPQLGWERAFSYSTSISQLCNVDIITVIHQGGGPMSGASCGLGAFQPVELAKK